MCYLLIFVHSRLFPPPTHFLSQMFPHFTTFSHPFLAQGFLPLWAGSALHLPQHFIYLCERWVTDPGVRGGAKRRYLPLSGERHSGRERKLWVQVYFWAAGAKACIQGGCMGGGSEGRERRWFCVCAHDGAQHNLCVCTAGRQLGMLGWDL